MSIKDLFTLKKSPETQAEPANTEAKLQNETYVQYGKRICGMVNASKTALAAFIHKIYNHERQAQANDEARQNELKGKANAELAKIETEIDATQNNLSNENVKKDTETENKNDVDSEIKRLEDTEGKLNRPAKTRMIVGSILKSKRQRNFQRV